MNDFLQLNNAAIVYAILTGISLGFSLTSSSTLGKLIHGTIGITLAIVGFFYI